MSSGTLIDANGHVESGAGASTTIPTAEAASRTAAHRAGDGFQAWHFFVLTSILFATVAVFMTRGSSPENLILLSFTVGASGLAAAAFYRMLLPLASKDPVTTPEPLTDRHRAALERDKALTLRTIKELEFDRAMGKLSQKDFDEMAGRLRQRAVSLIKQLDQRGGYAAVIEQDLQKRLTARKEPDPAAGAACGCGTANDADAVFCKKCGARLQAS